LMTGPLCYPDIRMLQSGRSQFEDA
jgi:hypothetical protein